MTNAQKRVIAKERYKVMIEQPCTCRTSVPFHSYLIFRNGDVINRQGLVLKTGLRERRGGGHDKIVKLRYGGKQHKWTVTRLVAACFLGPIHGYEMNHKVRDITLVGVDDIERTTPKENQKHWRSTPRDK